MKTLHEIDPNDCRYVCDDEYNFCARPKHVYWKVGGGFAQSSYCTEHHALCTRAFVEKKEYVA